MAATWSPPAPSCWAGVPSKRTFAARVLSCVRYPVRVRPSASPETRNRPVPPPTTALTTSRSARAPLGTGSLTPVSVQPSALSVAVTPSAVGLQRVPGSAWAKTAIVVPSAMPPRISPFCSAVPTAATRPPASTTVPMNGSRRPGRPAGPPAPPGQHDRHDERLGRQHPADLLGDDGHLDRAGPHAAVLLRERQPQQPHLGQPRPRLLVEAGVGLDHRPARLAVGVRPGQEGTHRVPEVVLLAVVVEVHGCLTTPGSSRR